MLFIFKYLAYHFEILFLKIKCQGRKGISGSGILEKFLPVLCYLYLSSSVQTVFAKGESINLYPCVCQSHWDWLWCLLVFGDQSVGI